MTTAGRILTRLTESARQDGFDRYRATLGADKVDTLLATLGMGPRYERPLPTVHMCPSCKTLGATYREAHADTDMNVMVLECSSCGYSSE